MPDAPNGSRGAAPFALKVRGPVTGAELGALREAVGWESHDTERYDRMIAGSYLHITVRQGDDLVGFLRVISDGVEDALICDLLMHPVAQGHGLGTALVSRAVAQLKAEGVRGVHVLCSERFERWYANLGFTMIRGGFQIVEGHRYTRLAGRLAEETD